VAMADRGPARLEGYGVVGVSPGCEAWAGRWHPPPNPFVGRVRELMLLESLLEQVKAGRGQVVSVVGAPGMGKSRLLNEFRQCRCRPAAGCAAKLRRARRAMFCLDTLYVML
jgi:hypothetical protein